LGNRNFISKIQKRGGRVDGVLRHPNKLSPEAVGDLRENFKGALQTGNFPILQNGVEYQSISLTPMDAEFINTHKLTARDVAAAYRVPLHMINDLERATFSNIEHQSLEFVKNTLLPWIKNWEEELNRKLLPADVQDSHFFRFNVEGMLRGDFRTRMDGYARAIQWGILNRDEVRDLENRNKIPDGAGEIFITPLNMAPLTEEGMQLSLFSGQSAGGDSLQQQQAQ
jgi:HK97 family phage portal protein